MTTSSSDGERDLYDVARAVTDEVLGDGTYEGLNRNHPDPGVQAAIRRARTRSGHAAGDAAPYAEGTTDGERPSDTDPSGT